MMRLKGKAAIVTGAAQGIGAAYAKALATEGASVAVWDILDTASVVSEITGSGGAAIGAMVDITDPRAVGEAVAQAISTFNAVHVLVNNAALFGNIKAKPFTEISTEEWDRVMAVNVRGTLECVKGVLPQMQEQKYGKIINISSSTVYRGTPFLMHYVASKGAVVAMTRCMARELGNDGIRANCICPGFTESETVLANKDYTADYFSTINNSRALKREEVPADLVGTLIYLASNDSDFVTGQTIVVDGGAIMP